MASESPWAISGWRPESLQFACQGPLAYCLLFSPDQHKALDPPPSPIFEWNGQILYTMAYGPGSPIDLPTNTYTRYRCSYHTTLPNHWAQQFLGLNFTCLLTNHLQSHLHKLQVIQHWQWLQSSTRKKLYDPVGVLVHIQVTCTTHAAMLYDLWSVGL
jgi:hypothetical protein